MTILSVTGIALGSAVTPYYANIAAKKDWEGLRRLLKRYIIFVLLLSIPLTAMLYFFAGPIVRLIYERGSFRARDTQIVAQVHAFYALQVPFYLGTVLIGRFLGSLLASHLLVWAAVINVSLNILLDILLIKPLGVSGLALASGCASLITFCFLSYVSLKEVNARVLR
jgi:putative peptidoglycan lipid II flippase